MDPLSFLFRPSSPFSFKHAETKSESQGSQKAAEEPGGNASSEALETQVRDLTSPGLRDGVGSGYCDSELVRVTTESCHLLQKGPTHTQVVRSRKFVMGKPQGHALEWACSRMQTRMELHPAAVTFLITVTEYMTKATLAKET